MGAWTLVGFVSGASATAFAQFMQDRYGPLLPLRVIENAGQAVSLAFGLPFSNYTGVLIGATAIPVWNESINELPIHFGMSGLSSAVGMLELMGHRKSRALQWLGLGAAIFGCMEELRIETHRLACLDPLRSGASGAVVRVGGVLSGPVSLGLRVMSFLSRGEQARDLRKWAAISAIAGSLITRFGWLHAGDVSAQDWREPLRIPHASE